MAEPILEINNLTLRFGGLTAVNNFSMQVKPKTIHALIGPNGAGKSTTFNCISGLYRPTSGNIRFLGNDLTKTPAVGRAKIGIARTFQNLELFSGLTVLENVLIGSHVHCHHGISILPSARPLGVTGYAEHLLERVGLIDFRHVRAETLDFGRQKMLELARALAIKPHLLLLDEPAAGLRNREIGALDRMLSEMVRKDGVTILLVEHVMQLVMSISDQITVLNFGTKIAEESPASILENSTVIEAYLGGGGRHDRADRA